MRMHLAMLPKIGAIAITAGIFACGGDFAGAQVSAPSAQSMANPDVQIVVIRLPDGGYAVSSVYPKQVSKAVAQGRVDRLLTLTKWAATNRKFSDAPAASNLLRDDTKKLLSAASFETTGAVYGADGTIDSEPFLRAFGDLRRVNLIFFTGADFAYRGPVAFESDRLRFSATAVPGTVSVAATVQPQTGVPSVFGLPKIAPQAQTAVVTKPIKSKTGFERGLGMLLIALAATGFVLIIYGIASRFVPKV